MIGFQKTEKYSKKFSVTTLFSVSIRKGAGIPWQSSSPVCIFFYGEQTGIFDSLLQWFMQSIVIVLC